MTVTILASISLLALVVTAAPLPKPNDARDIERLSLDVQNSVQTQFESRIGQTPKCVGCDDDPDIQVVSVEEQHSALAALAEVGAVKAVVPIDLQNAQGSDEKKLYNIIHEMQTSFDNSSSKEAEAPLSEDTISSSEHDPIPSEDAEDPLDGELPSPGMTPAQIRFNLTCMAIGVTVGCVFGLLWLKFVLSTNASSQCDDLPNSEKPGHTEDGDLPTYGDEKKLVVDVSNIRPQPSPPVAHTDEDEKLAMRAELSLSESGYSSDDDLNEKFVDAEEPPAPLVDTSVPDVPTPQIVVLQHPDPELLPLPTDRPSTPYSTPPPTPPRSPLRRPLQMREAGISSPLARPAWSVRASDAPSLGLASYTPSLRASPSPVMRTLSSAPVSRPDTPTLFIPGAFATEDEDEKGALSEPTTRSRAYRSPVPELDIAFAMQLRPGLGLGSDPAWLVRFLMAMFGWMTVFIGNSSQARQNRRAIA